MTDKPGGGDPPDKPKRPDPFAPLPLADSLSGPKPTEPAVRPDPFAPKPLDRSLSGPTKSPGTPAPPVLPPAASPAPPVAAPPPAPVVEAAPPTEPWTPPPPEWPAAPDLLAQSAPEPLPDTEPPAPEPTPDPMPPHAPPTDVIVAAPEAPLLPETFHENDLRDAVGATPRPDKPSKKKKRKPVDDEDDGDRDGKPGTRSRKPMFVAAMALVVGSGIAAMTLLGRVNSGRYRIACEADRVVVQQGRALPPWGEKTLGGAEWKALKIPPEAECHPRETEDQAELAGWYVKILVDQASALLTAREVTKVDDAEAQLKQALLVTRSLRTDDDRLNWRKDIERLLGDVVYWRASAKLRTASEALTEAAKQFDVAAAQRPRHVSDAAAWANYVRKLVEDLKAGPAGAPSATFPPLAPPTGPTAAPGTELPVEPGAGSGSATEPVAPPADAGLPTGGVLL